jgi:Fe-S cluster assembly iron-binding protein IscA
MLTITDNAAEAVRAISEGSGLAPDPGLRISVGEPTPQGTPLEISIAPGAEATDETVEEHGARVYLEDAVAPALDDKVLDAEMEGEQVRFALREALPGTGENGNVPGI